jgi:hypothetical protein
MTPHHRRKRAASRGPQWTPRLCARVCDHLVELQPDRRVVGGDDGAGADADDGVQRHAVPHELLEDPGVGGEAQDLGPWRPRHRPGLRR